MPTSTPGKKVKASKAFGEPTYEEVTAQESVIEVSGRMDGQT